MLRGFRSRRECRRRWRCTGYACGAVVAICVLLFGASVVAGARLRREVPGRVKWFASDGGQYVAWQVGIRTPLVLLNTITGRRRKITLTEDCSLEDDTGQGETEETAADGRFLLNCNYGEKLLDVKTGKLTSLPIRAPDGEDYIWSLVGRYYVVGPKFAYDIATGAVSAIHEEADPKAPGDSLNAVCSGLRVRIRHNGEESLPILLAFTNRLFALPLGKDGAVHLERCDHKPTSLGPLAHEQEAESIDLRSGLLTWDTGLGGERPGRQRSFTGTLYAYDLASGEREHWTLPVALGVEGGEEKGPFGYSTHTANMVFWLAEAGATGGGSPLVDQWRIYAANR